MMAKPAGERLLRVLAVAIDPVFYNYFNPDVVASGADAVSHYAWTGWREGRDPNPWFSTTAYLASRPDLLESDVNPLYEFLLRGGAVERSRDAAAFASRVVRAAPVAVPAESRPAPTRLDVPEIRDRPAPRVAETAESVVRAHFDPAFYQVQTEALGTSSALDGVHHYLTEGAAAGLDPSREFSTRFYVESHPELVGQGWNPFHHYLKIGQALGWAPRAPAESYERGIVGAEFNAAYYLARYPDVAERDGNPLDHFMEHAASGGHDPNPNFSSGDYLRLYPDIAASGVNPFFHFIVQGRSEGRVGRENLGPRAEILNATPTAFQRLKIDDDDAVVSVAGEDLLAIFRDLDWASHAVHLVFDAHDPHVAKAAAIAAPSLDQTTTATRVWLSPAIEASAISFEEPELIVHIGDEQVARAGAASIATAVEGLLAHPASSFAIHSLRGHSIGATIAMLRGAERTAGDYWVQDYAAICDGHRLLRNDVKFCGAPPPSSPACGICHFGEQRVAQIAAHRRLFDTLDLRVLAPSSAAAAIWDKHRPAGSAAAVVPVDAPLQRVEGHDHGHERLRVAFVGEPSAEAGWPLFRELALRFASDRRYSFHHIGPRTDLGLPIRFEPVTSQAELDSALARLEIDLVLVLSLWPETFSARARNAIAQGVRILALEDGGDAASVARTTGGHVVRDENALNALFATHLGEDVIEAGAA